MPGVAVDNPVFVPVSVQILVTGALDTAPKSTYCCFLPSPHRDGKQMGKLSSYNSLGIGVGPGFDTLTNKLSISEPIWRKCNMGENINDLSGLLVDEMKKYVTQFLVSV